MHSKMIKDDLSFVLFSKDYMRFHEPKAKRKAFYLLESAIQCFARRVFGQVSLEMIAREAGVSRTLIKYYFDNIDEIELYAIKHIRVSAQKLAINALEQKSNPRQMLQDYTHACLSWANQYRTHALVWLSFVHRCGRDKRSRILNSESVEAGTNRIQSLLELGKASGHFHCIDTKRAAKLIQITITGALCTMASENLTDENGFITGIEQQCLSIAEGQMSSQTVTSQLN